MPRRNRKVNPGKGSASAMVDQRNDELRKLAEALREERRSRGPRYRYVPQYPRHDGHAPRRP